MGFYSTGFSLLTVDQQRLFERVFESHHNAMGSEMRKKYSRDNISKITWNAKEKCLHVHFTDGEWWHYATDGMWY
ncbi:hypothetical protein [Paenibacillus tyrfis]|uniref:hypothetical protein n=1 Tax=Paenibacillus tyrfis TaxID=1501230 RepID=UPI0020A16108|nr:hypothetical protein [Paenibacillus tyrfis]MCP1312073.1 hypothetical protein [Paenibacillus tyrfis]